LIPSNILKEFKKTKKQKHVNNIENSAKSKPVLKNENFMKLIFNSLSQ
jgi:hypothetical protein